MRYLPTLFLLACAAPPAGLRATPPGEGPTVRFDWDAEPLPDLPFPNDLATRPDPTSPTSLRPNLPLEADIALEQSVRTQVNGLSGWGIFSPITVGFEGALDLDAVLARHPPLAPFTPDSFADDAILLIDVTPGSPDFGQPIPIDLGTQRYPQDATQLGTFLQNDPRASEPSLLWDTGEEDLDGDGVLDPGEDTDGDGILDHPNVWPPGGDHRQDLLSWYDRETNALVFRPVTPLREATTYAVVLTSQLVDADGAAVRSPFAFVNHTRQTEGLRPAVDALAALGRPIDDIAFAWTFTTGEVTEDLWALAQGLRGRGTFAWLADSYPAGGTEGHYLWDARTGGDPLFLPIETLIGPLSTLGFLPPSSLSYLEDAYPAFTAGVVGGAFVTPDLLFDRDDGGRDDSDEVWSVDRLTGWAETRPRRIAFSCAIPRATPEHPGPFPIAVHMHGYGSTRVELVAFAYALNRQGIAVCGLDAHGHGLALSESDTALVSDLLALSGTEPLWWHLQDDRLRDLNNDGLGDPAGDMFPPNPFHAQDMLRQPVLDTVQLVASLRRCGEGQMSVVVPSEAGPFDTGSTRTTCDWDGDGRPDIGGPGTPVVLHGASMGGVMTSLAAAVQEADAAVPLVPGGGLADVAARTDIGAISDGMVGRALSPLIIGVPTGDGVSIQQVVISVDQAVNLPIATVPALPVGGAVRVTNLASGHAASVEIPADDRFRVAIAANAPDAIEKALLTGIPASGVAAGEVYGVDDNVGLGDPLRVEILDAAGSVVETIDRFAEPVVHEGVTYAAASPLVAGSWGLGLIRGSADLRRTVGVLALGIEAGDPIAYARRWALEPFDGVPADVLVQLTVGDTTVPIGTGVALARAARIFPVDREHPKLGMTVDQWLVEQGVIRGMEQFGPHVDANGAPILFDPDDLDRGADGSGAPSGPPLRAHARIGDADLALRMLYISRYGTHAYLLPDEELAFDWNLFSANQMAWFLASGEVSDDPCLATRNCPFYAQLPESP